ncbi:hypothetical protein P3X46_019795 [Hevea brasiliensis]|uniref:Ferrochelatase n=1 Tax=Hevea brasiliensis TaxID=3981 RepID=A0ABQ9LLT0_HEVBR|nr:hypothetical protein P3X46_019795 [Hevea brasiliensis]
MVFTIFPNLGTLKLPAMNFILEWGSYRLSPAQERNPVGQTFCAASAGVYTYGESLLESHSHTTEDRVGVLLLNLGGPETFHDVQPFLFNLFADPDIIRLPRLFQFLQRPIAQYISAHAIKMALEAKGMPANVYVGMRYWYPFTEEAIHLIKRDQITRLVVLPLYPQFSISTTGSSLSCTWNSSELCGGCSHAGDPYKDQMEECIFLIMRELKARGIDNDHTLAYQSRVGPAQWLKPYTDEVLVELGQKGVKSLLAVPVSFVSEHIETLEEIDMEDKHLALESGIENWGRVPALGCTPSFITDLADAVVEALPSAKAMSISKSTSQEADYDPLSYAIKMFFGPLSYAIKMFFGSILAFVLL